ncbi:hypothetical protein G3436_24915 [Pseudomonas sp. MAFF212427]|uniref:Beta-ketoadipyl CoA thiolase n=1 Tax=Pseudomonas brassicae TaxID=2708063 RepID=A0A6B3NTC3_9PSED|nr:hypothetical protein [Pseudomonas brassicae]
MTKDELRAQLERQEQRYKDVYGGEVTTYAAQPDPERKPWRKRASVLDQAFAEELQKNAKGTQATGALTPIHHRPGTCINAVPWTILAAS